jgi:hypothetical protein
LKRRHRGSLRGCRRRRRLVQPHLVVVVEEHGGATAATAAAAAAAAEYCPKVYHPLCTLPAAAERRGRGSLLHRPPRCSGRS